MMILGSCTGESADELPAPFKVTPQTRHVQILSGKGLEFGGLSGIELKGLEKIPQMGKLLSQLPENKLPGKGLLILMLALLL